MKYINKLTDKDIINITSIISNNNLVDILCVDKLSNELQIIYTIKKSTIIEEQILILSDYDIESTEDYHRNHIKFIKYMLTKFGIKYIIDLSKKFQFNQIL